MSDAVGMEPWQIWLIVACVVAVVELMVLNLYYLLAVAGGALVVAVVAGLIDISTATQWLIFAVATGAVALLMRSLRSPKKKEIPDDASYMVGKRVEVIERVAPRGRAVYKSVTWSAESNEVLEKGDFAEIVHVRGSTLYIEKKEEKA